MRSSGHLSRKLEIPRIGHNVYSLASREYLFLNRGGLLVQTETVTKKNEVLGYFPVFPKLGRG